MEPVDPCEAMYGAVESPTGGELLSHTMEGGSERFIDIKPRGIVITERVILFELEPSKHPTLFNSLRRDPEPNGFKYVKVIYPQTFKRVIREEGPMAERSSSGRPKRSTAWMYYGNPLGDCCCGRKFRGYRGRSEHWRSKGDKSEICEIRRIQADRDRCFFCNEVISPSDKFRCIEEHTRKCGPLMELKTLIHPFHLEDMGLQEAEIMAFKWPVLPHLR